LRKTTVFLSARRDSFKYNFFVFSATMLENIVKKLGKIYKKPIAKQIEPEIVFFGSFGLTLPYYFNPFFHASGVITYATGRMLNKISHIQIDELTNSKEFQGLVLDTYASNILSDHEYLKEYLSNKLLNVSQSVISTILPPAGYGFFAINLRNFFENRKDLELLNKFVEFKKSNYKTDISFDSIKKSNIFLKLSEQELRYLEGRIESMDIVKGCRNSCIGCYVEHKNSTESVPYKDVKKIISDMKELKEKSGIDLMLENTRDGFTVYYGSDPIYYTSKDSKGNEKTLFDVVKLFYKNHKDQTMAIMTSGWKPGYNPIQKGMEKFSGSYPKEREKVFVKEDKSADKKEMIKISNGYSIKPFGNLIRTDYTHFLNEIFGSIFEMENKDIKERYGLRAFQLINFKNKFKKDFEKNKSDFNKYSKSFDISKWKWFIKSNLDTFFYNSIYIKNTIDNIKTEENIITGCVLYYTENFRTRKHFGIPEALGIRKLKPELRKFEYMFTKDFMIKVKEKIESNLSQKMPFEYRPWFGSEELNQKQHKVVIHMKNIENCIKANKEFDEIPLYYTYVNITGDGEINILYQKGPHLIGSVPIPKKYFKNRAEHYKNIDINLSEKYQMLYNLQGKNILANPE
jgi:hypothetical protein